LLFGVGIGVAVLVYIGGNGSFFESNLDSNSIGKYLGRSEPTKTGGNYFAWKITNKNYNRTFFIDQLDGEIISQMMYIN